MSRRKRYWWERLSDSELLDVRLRDLEITYEDTWLEERIDVLLRELEAKNLLVRPSFWLSHEWFSPAGIPGIALPFYLAHPRLVRLERKQMLEVEGDNRTYCLRILRHETGHVVQSAYRLNRRRAWQSHFGRSSEPYPDHYRPNPRSRRFVVNLAYWYAQSHPDEDFAETFAVWLTPGSGWRRRYDGWPALRKLQCVDTLMQDIAGKKPIVSRARKIEALPQLRMTLRDYYKAKHERYSVGTTDIYDRDLRRLFRAPPSRAGIAASSFLRAHRTEIRRLVVRNTEVHEFTLDTVLKNMIARCRELRLRAVGSPRQLMTDFAIMLAARGVEYVYRGREWHAL